MNNKSNPEEILSYISNMKDAFNELKSTISDNTINLDLSKNYFNPEITRVIPVSFVAKKINNLSFNESISLFESFLSYSEKIYSIYKETEYFSIKKHLQLFSEKNPFYILKGIMEFILYPHDHGDVNKKTDKNDETNNSKKKKNKNFKKLETVNFDINNKIIDLNLNNLVFLNNLPITKLLDVRLILYNN